MEFLIFMVLLYFLPTILAIGRHPTHDPFGIFLVNFFLGWTVIGWWVAFIWALAANGTSREFRRDRKSTRLNSSHSQISYAVFCLKKKNNTTIRLSLTPIHLLSSALSTFSRQLATHPWT